MKQFSGASKVALLLLAFALPAAAQGKPIIQMQPFTSGFVSATESGCGFDILMTPQAGKPNLGRVILFANTEIILGPLFVTAQNLSNNKTINLNISGPGKLFFSDMTFALHGVGLTALPLNVARAAGLPQMPLLKGQLVGTFDADFNFASVSFTGTAQDFCPMLQ